MQKTTRLQRLLAVIVAVFMAVCCLPLNAFAADGGDDASNYSLWDNTIDVTFHFTGDGVDSEYKTKLELPNRFHGEQYYVKELVEGNVPEGYELKDNNQTFKVYDYDAVCGKRVEVEVVRKEQTPVEEKKTATYNLKYVDQADPTKEVAPAQTVTAEWTEDIGPALLKTLSEKNALPEVENYTRGDVYLENGGVYDESAVMVEGTHNLIVYYTADPVEPEVKPSTYTFNFYQVGDTSKTIHDSVSVTITDFDNLVDKYVMDYFVSARTELEGTGEWTYDHYESAYNPGVPGQPGAVVVPDVNMVYNVYFKPVSVEPEQKSTYTFNFYELGNKDNVLYTAYTVEVTDFSENAADKYVMDLFAKGRKAVEDTGKWTYVSYESDYNPGVEGQVDALIVPNVNMVYNVYFAPVSAEKKSTYTFNFYETDNKDKVLHEAVTVEVTDFDNLVDKYVMDLFATARKEIEDSGNWSYNFYESEYGIEGQVDSLVVPGVNLSYNVYFNCNDRNSKYTIHFVDENNNEFMDPAVVNMAWVEGQELNLMTQLKSTLDSVSAKGYTFKTLTAWNGTEAYKGDELVVPGEYELIAHCVKNTSGSTGDDSSDKNNNSNKTVSSSNNQVVKAEAPADNTAKIMPQTGLTAETPVVFGVMMVAALAGAGAYLFAIRKKLN